MRLLILEWSTYTYKDVAQSFTNNNVSFYTVSYQFGNKNKDDFFIYRFSRFLEEGQYDAVFSTNYFPLAAECCHRKHIKYVSWSYDNPLNVEHIEDTLGYPENYVFLFDKIQVDGYRNKGFDNVYHMPLAVNLNRLNRINITDKDRDYYSSDIAFVGKLYKSDLQLYMSAMDDETKLCIEEIMTAQSKLYGRYIVDEVLTSEFIEHINNYFEVLMPGTKFRMSKEALSYAISSEITRKDRLVLLKLLSSHFELKMYSDEKHDLLDKCTYMGTCNYVKEMPKIFKLSKINLNINLRISQSGVPLRVMDILGCGGFLLSSMQPEIIEYFASQGGAVCYESIEDAYYKCDYYLKHEDERQKIASKGLEIVSNNFTYDMQFKKIFEISGLI